MSTSPSLDEPPESRFWMDGWRVERPPRRRPVQRHYPGGVQHDQQQHAGSRALGPTDPAPPRTYGPGGGRIETVAGWRPDEASLAKAERWYADQGFTKEMIKERLSRWTEDKERSDDWYLGAHEDAAALAKHHGVHRDRAAAVLAATSPNNEWDDAWGGPGSLKGSITPPLGNQRAADRIIGTYMKNEPFTVSSARVEAVIQKRLKPEARGHRLTPEAADAYREAMRPFVDRPVRPQDVPPHILAQYHPNTKYIPNNAEKAYAILAGGDPNDILSGQKVRSFYDNVARGGEGSSVTIDTHEVNAIFGGDVDRGLALAPAHPERYEYLAEVHREVTPQGATPSGQQASVWTNYRDSEENKRVNELGRAEGRARRRAKQERAVSAIAGWAAGTEKTGSTKKPTRDDPLSLPPIGDPLDPDAQTTEEYEDAMTEYYVGTQTPAPRRVVKGVVFRKPEPTLAPVRRAVRVLRHLPGKHDQLTHGRGGGRGEGSSSDAKYYDMANPFGNGRRSPYPDSEGEKVRQRILSADRKMKKERQKLIDAREKVVAEAKRLRDESRVEDDALRATREAIRDEFGYMSNFINPSKDPAVTRDLFRDLGDDEPARRRLAELVDEAAIRGERSLALWAENERHVARSMQLADEIETNARLSRKVASDILFGTPAAYADIQVATSPDVPNSRREEYHTAQQWAARALEPTLGGGVPIEGHGTFAHRVNIMALPPGRRAHYTGDRSIHVGPSDSDTTMVHELGHFAQQQIPGAAERSQVFLNRRAGPRQDAVSLREITNSDGYEGHEVTTPDEFIAPYVGKRYESAGSSETLSMGMQYMYSDPAGFARGDPDHFVHTYNTIRGIPDGDTRGS